MELIRGIQNIHPRHHGCVLTIGKFDGVHTGHQAVLKNLIEQAKILHLPATVMVFEPQPEEYFTPEQAPARLSNLRDKYERFAHAGVQRLICVKFDAAFAAQSPQDFVENLLVNALGVKFLVVGDDFRFGHKRKGDFNYLQQVASSYGFDVVSTQSFRIHDSRISSTQIRQALADSDFPTAAEMLGRPYAISGKVVHGEKKGRTINFPTANVLVPFAKPAITGVFAVRIKIECTQYFGVANLGFRPTLNGKRLQLETHIFDLNANLYGKRIVIQFIAKIRNEEKFSNFEQLTLQIQKDAQQAKDLLMNAK